MTITGKHSRHKTQEEKNRKPSRPVRHRDSNTATAARFDTSIFSVLMSGTTAAQLPPLSPRGISFIPTIDEDINRINHGDMVVFRHIKDNEYDPHAVAMIVLTTNEHGQVFPITVGWMPKELNTKFLSLCHKGHFFYGTVSQIFFPEWDANSGKKIRHTSLAVNMTYVGTISATGDFYDMFVDMLTLGVSVDDADDIVDAVLNSYYVDTKKANLPQRFVNAMKFFVSRGIPLSHIADGLWYETTHYSCNARNDDELCDALYHELSTVLRGVVDIQSVDIDNGDTVVVTVSFPYDYPEKFFIPSDGMDPDEGNDSLSRNSSLAGHIVADAMKSIVYTHDDVVSVSFCVAA